MPIAAWSGEVATSQSDNSTLVKNPVVADVESTAVRFNRFNTLLRDGKIRKSEAKISLNALLDELRQDFLNKGGKDYSRKEWVFPLAGYDQRAITGGRNKGYISSGYDYFTGNRHGGHPSFDIFIRDRNQDSNDDRSGELVKVLSMTGGIVVAMEEKWERGSKLRGGAYIWIYDPVNNLLVYYAHNSKLFVSLGDMVKPGDLLATVGRSGLNAAKRRSPTHLHLTVLEIKNGRPVPLNVYPDLVSSRKM
jgi:murein DD-endopeptidase MepM/ murein hydrolase activator NlpD